MKKKFIRRSVLELFDEMMNDDFEDKGQFKCSACDKMENVGTYKPWDKTGEQRVKICLKCSDKMEKEKKKTVLDLLNPALFCEMFNDIEIRNNFY